MLNWGWGMGYWGLGIGPNPQSPIPNPQSPIPILKILKFNMIYTSFIYLKYFKSFNFNNTFQTTK